MTPYRTAHYREPAEPEAGPLAEAKGIIDGCRRAAEGVPGLEVLREHDRFITATDYQMLRMLSRLIAVAERQEREISELRSRVDAFEAHVRACESGA